MASLFLVLDNVHLRKPGISDMVRTNGVRAKAQWVALGTGTVMYTSSVKDTKAQAEVLARAWLAKNPQHTENTAATEEQNVAQKQSKSDPTQTSTASENVTPATSEANPEAPVPNTHYEANLKNLTRILIALNTKLDTAQHNISAFTVAMGKDPVHALNWSVDTFLAAARLQVIARVIRALTAEDGQPAVTKPWPPATQNTEPYNTLAQAKVFATEEICRRARVPSYSTSPAANLMEQQLGVAWAEVLEMLQRFD